MFPVDFSTSINNGSKPACTIASDDAKNEKAGTIILPFVILNLFFTLSRPITNASVPFPTLIALSIEKYSRILLSKLSTASPPINSPFESWLLNTLE